MKTRAQKLHNRKRFVPKEIKQAAEEILDVAMHTGDRAYRFMRFEDESMVEVRVWPDGTVKITEVDTMGRGIAPKERKKLKFT